MIFNQRLPQIILLITVLFLFPAIINASDSYIAAIVDLGMEGGFGGGAWYTDYYNWVLTYGGLEVLLGERILLAAGCSYVFTGFFWNNRGPIPEASVEYAFISKRDMMHLITAKARACFVGFDVLQLYDFHGDYDYGDNVWHLGDVKDIYLIAGYRMRWVAASDFYMSPYVSIVAQRHNITDFQRVEISEGLYEPGIYHTQHLPRTECIVGIELRGPFFRLILETGYVNHMFYLVTKAGGIIGIPF